MHLHYVIFYEKSQIFFNLFLQYRYAGYNMLALSEDTGCWMWKKRMAYQNYKDLQIFRAYLTMLLLFIH